MHAQQCNYDTVPFKWQPNQIKSHLSLMGSVTRFNIMDMPMHLCYFSFIFLILFRNLKLLEFRVIVSPLLSVHRQRQTAFNIQQKHKQHFNGVQFSFSQFLIAYDEKENSGMS